MLWDHRPTMPRFAGIVAQEIDRGSLKLRGERHLIFPGTERGFTEAPHLYKHDGWYHLLVAEGGTGWQHAAVMARSRSLLGPYEVHPDGAVLTAAGRREGGLTRAGHADLIHLVDGTPWMAYLCGRPLPGRERCIFGRETALQPMQWGTDGWLRTTAGDATPDAMPPVPDLPSAPAASTEWDGRFTGDALPAEFQWLRTPYPTELFSLHARPGYLRLYGRETVGSFFTQSLVARRQEHFRYRVLTKLEYAPENFQQSAGLIYYYNSTKFFYLFITCNSGHRQLCLMTASPENDACEMIEIERCLPDGPIELSASVDHDALRLAWRADGLPWSPLPMVLDASVLADEVSLPGLPNFTGAFVGLACQDMAGTAVPADFEHFIYEGEDPES
jgi:xylan 1,4-beta-xylosidase